MNSSRAQRVVIVTGAASGIGWQVAEKFLREGWDAGLIDNNAAEGRSAADKLAEEGRTCFVCCDVSQAEQVKSAIELITRKLGRLDAVINVAGVLGPDNFLEAEDHDLERVITVNLTGCLYMSKYSIRHMKANGGGAIVNISSIASFKGSPKHPAYAASKAGLIALAKSLARHYARNNIRVNCVCPGSVSNTNILQNSRGRGLTREEKIAIMRQVPIGRTLQPAEVADLVFFMVSPAAAAMTGTAIVLDGGEMLGY